MKLVVTGAAVRSTAGADIAGTWETLCSGRPPVEGASPGIAGGLENFDPATLVANRKLHKMLQRADFLGLHSAAQALEAAGLVAHRESLSARERDSFDSRSGAYTASGGATFRSQHELFPLLGVAEGNLRTFGGKMRRNVSPLLLLRSLPNNVLCHIGIEFGWRGPNTCFTNYGVSSVTALGEAVAALRDGRADRAVVVGYDSPTDAQTVRYFRSCGLLARDALRPFDRDRDGFLLGEGAGAIVIETATAAAARDAPVLAEIVGTACTTEGCTTFDTRPDGAGLARAVDAALAAAGLARARVGLVVAHGEGSVASDASEAAALCRVFPRGPPPLAAFKWAYGHCLAASGMLDTVLAVAALQRGYIPGTATFRTFSPDCEGARVSADRREFAGEVVIVLSRGFGGTNAVAILRRHDPGKDSA